MTLNPSSLASAHHSDEIFSEEKTSADFYRELLDKEKGYRFLLDSRGNLCATSLAFEPWLGYKKGQLRGVSLEKVFDLTHWRSLTEGLSSTRHKKLKTICSTALFSKKGRSLPVTLKLRKLSPEMTLGEATETLAKRGKIAKQSPEAQAELVQAIEQERMRIGQDLHDGVGQLLTGILSLLDGLEIESPKAQKPAVKRIHDLTAEAMQEVRALSHGLAPMGIEDRSLLESLQMLAKKVSHSKLRCKVECSQEPKIKASATKLHLFRIAQEAVSNAIKHGKPKRITIYLKSLPGKRGLMEIHDDGMGIDQSKLGNADGCGTRVMLYRINLVGGKLAIRPGEKRGVVITCHFSCGI